MSNALEVIRTEIQSNEVMAKISACLGKSANDPAVLKFITGAIMTIQNKPDLMRCAKQSIIDSLVELAVKGLPVDNRHLAYLIPWQNKATGEYICSPMPGYQGYLYRIKQAEPSADFTIGLVYKGDAFTASKSSGQAEYTHNIANPFEDNPDNIIGAYMYTKTDSGSFLEVMSYEELLKVKSQSKMETGAIWKTWPLEMIKKSMVRRGGKVNFTAAIADLDAMDNRFFKSIETTVISEARVIPQRKSEIAKTEKAKIEHKPVERAGAAEPTKAEPEALAARKKAELHSEDKRNPPANPETSPASDEQSPDGAKTAIGFITTMSEPNKWGYVKTCLDGFVDEDLRDMGFSSKDPEINKTLANHLDKGEKVGIVYVVRISKGFTNYDIVELVSIQEPAEAQTGD